jgi:hypothetical protein
MMPAIQKISEQLSSLNLNLPESFRGLRYQLQIPASARTVRKMAESLNHQEIHELLVEVARKAGDMITSAQPHVNTSGSKKNCTWNAGGSRRGAMEKGN